MNLRCDFEAATKVCHVVVVQPVIKQQMPEIVDICHKNEINCRKKLRYTYSLLKGGLRPEWIDNRLGPNQLYRCEVEEAWMSLCTVKLNDIKIFWQFNSKHQTKYGNCWIVNAGKPRFVKSQIYNSQYVSYFLKVKDSMIFISSASNSYCDDGPQLKLLKWGHHCEVLVKIQICGLNSKILRES